MNQFKTVLMRGSVYLLLILGLLVVNSDAGIAQEKDSDSVSTGSEVADADSSGDDEAEVPWMMLVRTEVEKSKMKNGVSLSGANSTSTTSLTVMHELGVLGRFTWSSMLGKDGGPLNWAADISYDYSAAEWISITAGFSHIKYLSDSINAISDLENALTLDVTAEFSFIDVNLGYEMYLGNNPAKYFYAEAGHLFTTGKFTANLTGSLTYMTQSIDETRLNALAVKLKRKNQASSSGPVKKKLTISGISSILFDLELKYELWNNVSLYLNPYYLISPKGEVSAKDKQLLWIIGLQYMKEF